jgi:predicted XRE-type DNA-binding protein
VLRGFGDASVLEIIESGVGGTYRAVYTVRFEAAVFVLHVFQKKSKAGKATPKPDMEMSVLLKSLRRCNVNHLKSPKGIKSDYEIGSGNVYADLGRGAANDMLIKAQLVHRISEILEEQGLTQVKAAALLGIPQPKLSSMLRGQFRGLSERKLMDCLTRLGQDVQIRVRHAPKTQRRGALSVVIS